MVKKITFGNFKGGVGKTTTSCLFAIELSKLGKKVLFIDLDPQANATDLINKTFAIQDVNTSEVNIANAIKENDLSKYVVNASENFDFIPSDLPLIELPTMLTEFTNNDYSLRAYVLGGLLYDIEGNYDFVIIDTPPTISDFTNNALVASDYGILVMQTQIWSKYSIDTYIKYINDLNLSHGTNCKPLGVVAVIVDKKGRLDATLIDYFKETNGDLLFDSSIYQSQRIKRYAATGVPLGNLDIHDKKAIKMYKDLTDEILERVEKDKQG